MALTALYDTSVVIAGDAVTLPAEVASGRWAVSSITLGELEAGVLAARDTGVRAQRLQRLLRVAAGSGVLDVDRVVASRYAQLRSVATRRPSNDLWIAATALAHDLTLVTADERQARLPLVRAAYVG